MDQLLFRVAIPCIAVGLLLLVRLLTHAPRIIWIRALEVGWIAGLVNLLADVAARNLTLWHYNMPGLILGLPLDLYVSVSLIYGSAISLIYWWIVRNHARYRWWFLGALPVYGLCRDYLGTSLTGSTFLVWDHPLWWVADLAAWATGLWCTLYVFHRASRVNRASSGARLWVAHGSCWESLPRRHA